MNRLIVKWGHLRGSVFKGTVVLRRREVETNKFGIRLLYGRQRYMETCPYYSGVRIKRVLRINIMEKTLA